LAFILNPSFAFRVKETGHLGVGNLTKQSLNSGKQQMIRVDEIETSRSSVGKDRKYVLLRMNYSGRFQLNEI